MNKPPAYQLYASDFYMDTLSWDCELVGMYIRLLNYEWINGAIPNNIDELARIVGYISDNRQWRSNFARLWAKLSSKFVPVASENGTEFLVNQRMEKEREKQAGYLERQRIKGEKRAKQMWNGHIATAIATAKPRVQPEDSSSSSFSSSSLKQKIKPSQHSVAKYSQDFEVFWDLYPNRNGKKVGKRATSDLFEHLSKEDQKQIIQAANNYANSKQAQDNFAKDAERFLKKDFWRDWLEPEKGDKIW